MTCRFCKKMDLKRGNLVKYSTRHWAHYGCWLEAKGLELGFRPSFDRVVEMLHKGLHDWQLKNFPVYHLSDWLDKVGVQGPGYSMVDMACKAIERAIDLGRVMDD